MQNEFISIGNRLSLDAESIGVINLLKEAMQSESKSITHVDVRATTNREFEYFVKEIERLGLRTIRNHSYISGTIANTYAGGIFVNDEMICELNCGGTMERQHFSLEAKIYSINEEKAQKLKKIFQDSVIEQAQQGRVFALVRSNNGIDLRNLGYAGMPLIKENYTAEAMADYNFVVKDLRSPMPLGRITILEGAPGTGKTTLARSLLTEVPNAMFVLIPPDLINSLVGPELLSVLLNNKSNYGVEGSIILILEDADNCLVPRQGDNMSYISSLLNLSDGIFGALFDIRIIATTNAKKTEIDSALLRPGRLSKRISINPFSYVEANKIFQRLVPGKEMPIPVEEEFGFRPQNKKSSFTLAEIYGLAREAGWMPTISTTKAINSQPAQPELNGHY